MHTQTSETEDLQLYKKSLRQKLHGMFLEQLKTRYINEKVGQQAEELLLKRLQLQEKASPQELQALFVQDLKDEENEAREKGLSELEYTSLGESERHRLGLSHTDYDGYKLRKRLLSKAEKACRTELATMLPALTEEADKLVASFMAGIESDYQEELRLLEKASRNPFGIKTQVKPQHQTTALVSSIERGEVFHLEPLLQKQTPLRIKATWGFKRETEKYDVDLFVLGLASGKATNEWFITYRNKEAPQKAIIHHGDNSLTNPEEMLDIDIAKIPATIQKLVIGLTIQDAEKKCQTFLDLKSLNFHLGFADMLDTAPDIYYQSKESNTAASAIILAEIYFYNGEWRFKVKDEGVLGGFEKIVEIYELK